jgi:hypothetical protein
MIVINTVSSTKFSFNGITYHKNFMPFVTGNKIAILNVYDGCIFLTDAPTHFSEYIVNGVSYASVNELQEALLDVIYTRLSLSGGGGGGTLNTIPRFSATGLEDSLLSQSGNQINLGTYAAFGVNNPGTPGEPGVDNDAYIGSIINNDFLIKVNNVEALRIDTLLRLKIANIQNATYDTDKFLVSDGGVVKYRTGAELLSDIGGASAGDLSGYVTLATAQTITGAKIFTQEILVNSVNIGRGGGNISGNTRVGTLALNTNTTGEQNTAIGLAALQTNLTGSYNTAIGNRALDNTTAGNNTAIGRSALSNNTTGGNNTAIGDLAGVFITTSDPNNTPSNSVFIGANTRAQDDNQTNQIVIGDSTTGNGSNTVTIGNSSITNNYFSGNVRGGAFIKSGGTSSQFLKADGSIDTNTYLTSSSLTNYVTLDSSQTITGAKDFTALLTGTRGGFLSSGSNNTFAINHSSGSGIALNINKAGNGEGLYVNKTSGSGNAATIIGTLNATTLVKSGGTSSQFLMADGSVNTNVLASGAYLPLSGGTLTGALNGTSATFSSTLGVGGASSGTYGTLSVFGGISIKNDSNAKLEIGRYNSSGAQNSYIKLGTNSNSLRITNNTDDADLLELTNSGNLGLGVTPSAWGTIFGIKVIDVGSKGSFYASDNDSNISFNQYFDGTNVVYKTNGTASRFALVGNEFQWRQAPSGTAGNAISFTQAMTLGANGNLLVGTDADTGLYKLDVNGRIRAYIGASGVSPRTDLGGTIIAEGTTRAGLYILTAGTAAGSYGSIWWGNGNTNTDAFITVANDTRAMAFGTADGTRLTIASTGAATFSSSVTAANGTFITTATTGTTELLRLSRNASGYGLTDFKQSYNSTFFANGKTLTLTNDSNTDFAHFAGNNAGTITNFILPTGSIKTGNPTGGTAQPFKVGSVYSTSSVFDGNVLQVEINGVSYDLMIADSAT